MHLKYDESVWVIEKYISNPSSSLKLASLIYDHDDDDNGEDDNVSFSSIYRLCDTT